MHVDDGSILHLGLCDVATRSMGMASLCSFFSFHCGTSFYVRSHMVGRLIPWSAHGKPRVFICIANLSPEDRMY